MGVPKAEFAVGEGILGAGQTDCAAVLPCYSHNTQDPGKTEHI